MRSVRPDIFPCAYKIMANAIGSALSGKGALELRDGRRGGESNLIARLPFPKVFQSDAAGQINWGKFATAAAVRTGDLTWFRGMLEGEQVLEGEVSDSPDASLRLDKSKLYIYTGVEIELAGFEFSIARGGSK